MPKKILGYVLKTCWIIAVLSMPTIIALADFLCFESNAFIYFLSILLTGITICVALFIWKKPYSLFALSFGFFITVVSCPVTLFFFKGYWYGFNSWFGGTGFSIILWSIIYSLPFSILSFLPTILSIVRWFRRKKRRQPIAADKTDDSRESEVTDETVR